MKKILIFFIILLQFTGTTQEEKEFGISFSGFLDTDIISDSRETADVWKGHFLLYPLNGKFYTDGNDLNAYPKSETSSFRGSVSFKTGNFMAAPELDYPATVYSLPNADGPGLALDEFVKITGSKGAGNFRVLPGVV